MTEENILISESEHLTKPSGVRINLCFVSKKCPCILILDEHYFFLNCQEEKFKYVIRLWQYRCVGYCTPQHDRCGDSIGVASRLIWRYIRRCHIQRQFHLYKLSISCIRMNLPLHFNKPVCKTTHYSLVFPQQQNIEVMHIFVVKIIGIES